MFCVPRPTFFWTWSLLPLSSSLSENCSLATLDWSRDGALTVGEPVRALPWKMKGKKIGVREGRETERERETKKKRSIR